MNESNHFDRNRRRKKSKYRFIRRHIKLFLLMCSCLAIMIFATHLTWSDDLHGGAKEPNRFSFAGTSESDGDLYIGATDSEETEIDETAWCLILVNKWNYIPDDYKVKLIELANGESVDTRIYPALQEMFDNAKSDNIYPIVASGYRTSEKQQSLMDEKINDYENEGYSAEEAKAKAETWVAVPGTSEHQLGIAVDINADGIHSTGEEVYEWLGENSYRFGFINRYPSDKTEITGINNEPWHYRYVGIAVATEIYNQGVCLEEYLNSTD